MPARKPLAVVAMVKLLQDKLGSQTVHKTEIGVEGRGGEGRGGEGRGGEGEGEGMELIVIGSSRKFVKFINKSRQ